MRPAQVSNEDLFAAVRAIAEITPEYRAAVAEHEDAQLAYLARGNEANRKRYDAARAKLAAAEELMAPAREKRARAGGWIR